MRKRLAKESKTVPRLVQFENNQDEYDRLDELQSLNTALCFLCSINADVEEVKSFLRAHPEALLLEGASRLVEESASFILLTRTCSCGEMSSCSRNRKAILDECLSQDFPFYKDQQHAEGKDTARYTQWGVYRQDLMLVEQDIRHWRREESNLQQQFFETAIGGEGVGDRRRSRWSCVASSKRVGNERLRQERSLTIVALKERHQQLLAEIRRARQLQFRLLKHTFNGIQRHLCTSKE